MHGRSTLIPTDVYLFIHKHSYPHRYLMFRSSSSYLTHNFFQKGCGSNSSSICFVGRGTHTHLIPSRPISSRPAPSHPLHQLAGCATATWLSRGFYRSLSKSPHFRRKVFSKSSPSPAHEYDHKGFWHPQSAAGGERQHI